LTTIDHRYNHIWSSHRSLLPTTLTPLRPLWPHVCWSTTHDQCRLSLQPFLITTLATSDYRTNTHFDATSKCCNYLSTPTITPATSVTTTSIVATTWPPTITPTTLDCQFRRLLKVAYPFIATLTTVACLFVDHHSDSCLLTPQTTINFQTLFLKLLVNKLIINFIYCVSLCWNEIKRSDLNLNNKKQ